MNVQDYSLDSLMENFSFVFQNVYLFHDTIANNIRFGDPGASMDEVVEAAKKACCHDFITKLPDGYDTVVGEKGASLSGGEKQRISIAHRLKTVRNADQIFVIDRGRIVQRGTHQELMEQDGIYSRFVDSRNQAIGWKLGS